MEIILELIGFKGDGAILRDKKNRDILWPKDMLPSNLETGSKVGFLLAENEDGGVKKALSKNILNEILDV